MRNSGEYLFNNTDKIERMKKIDEEISLTSDETDIANLNNEWSKLDDSLITYDFFFESVCDMYNNIYRGQDGNGYYFTNSTEYQDFIYGEDEEGNDVVINYVTDGKNGDFLRAWIDE